MASKNESSIDVMKMDHVTVRFCLLGRTPIILNRMSNKVNQDLLMPKGRKTAADKASTLKHNPWQEFRDSPYLIDEDDAPTYIAHLASAFKGAIRGAALDLPGSSKAQIGRLTWVEGERIPIYGIPKVMCSVTRSADINRTPDIRTRAVIPEWACTVDVTFVSPLLREQAVANLMSMAGMVQGIGDWRTGKGSGTYGQFIMVQANDPRFNHLIKHGGRKAQKAAMSKPEPYDRETSELLDWFDVEVKRRGFKEVA